MQMRTRPRLNETISILGTTKWKLDALALAGRRSRGATIEVLMEHYFRHHPAVRDFVEERMNDPHPIQLRREKAALKDAANASTATPEDPSA